MTSKQQDREVDSQALTARPYQDQLLELALKQNAIIYLPTGAGKTFIALMAIRRMADELQGSIKDGAKRTVFLTNTVALAHQQVECIRQNTPLKATVYTGDMNVDAWREEKWISEFENSQVIVATCQIVLDVIRHGFMSITDFNLLIFDECHHAKNDHPMHQLMKEYGTVNRGKLPRVIGLTGALIVSSSANTLIEELEKLEAVFRATIITAANFNEFQNIMLYSTKPEELIITYQDLEVKPGILTKVELLTHKCLDIIERWNVDKTHLKPTKNMGKFDYVNPAKKFKKLWNDYIHQISDFGIFGASIAILSVIVNLELKKRSTETTEHRNLVRVCISFAEQIRHLLVDYLSDEMDTETMEEIILTNSSPKLQTFLMHLKSSMRGKKFEDIKCLVFVQRRLTAKNLYHIIRLLTQDNTTIPIIPDFMVGQSAETMPDSIENILERKWSKNVLTRFRRSECNLIVCSSVLEEGIDVQSCNYVMTYDSLKSFRSYVQTKGRARMQDSKYVIFVSAVEKSQQLSKIQRFREMDLMLKNFLIGKTIDRKVPLKEESDKQFEELIEPFYTSIGAKLDAKASIQLLNRYCMSLPNDIFTIATVEWKKISGEDNKPGCPVIVQLVLPSQSTIKENILSDPMNNAKWAKRSAAFKACKMLYERGELNEHLLPINKVKCIQMVDPVYFKHWESFKDDALTAGTKKMKRTHKIAYPEELCGATPQPKQTGYLYILVLHAEFDRNRDTAHVYDALQTTNDLAIFTSKRLPKLAAMPFFLTQGKVIAEIVSTPVEVIIDSEADMQTLRNFHVMIFRDLLRVWQPFFANDFRNEENSYLIVPTCNKKQINWELVRSSQSLPIIQIPSEFQRKRMNIQPDDYLNNVVTTWYTVDTNLRYVITKIRDDLTPLSSFPNSQFDNFAGYFENKYRVNIEQPNQFMLEAKGITTKLNRLHHGEGASGGKRKLKRLDDIILIPELLHNFKFPGDMWLKAIFLPSILHRLHYLLFAEKLRVTLNNHVNVPSTNYNPMMLGIDEFLRRVKKTESTVQTPVMPDPQIVKSKQLKNQKTLGETAQYSWKEYEEPCDIERFKMELYKIELDYHHLFISHKIVTDPKTDPNQGAVTSILANTLAICDTPYDEKSKIQIIHIDESKAKSPEQFELLCAITASSSNDVFDMERYEILGDSFLKLAISMFLIKNHPTWNEGLLTSVKGKFVSNRNLLYCAITSSLPEIMKTFAFSPFEDWSPPLLAVPNRARELVLRDNICPNVLFNLKLSDQEVTTGQCNEETLSAFYSYFPNEGDEQDTTMQVFLRQNCINDKSCADSVEAILGVCVQNYGIRKTFSVLQFLGICPKGDNLWDLLKVTLGNPRLSSQTTDRQIDALLINYKELEQNLGYKFRDRAYLLQAVTHPSFPSNRITGCYQQLEFIGDAVLDFLISSYIFEKCKHMDPGKITDLRSALVNNVTLACLTVRNKFHLFMLSQSAPLTQSIAKFAKIQEMQHFEVSDQVRILVSEKEADSPTMADFVEVPKALGDIFESLIGAVFLDCANDLETTWKVIYRLMSNEINKFMLNVPIQVVRQLYEYHGANPKFSDPFVDDTDVMVKCTFSCKNEIREVCGFGTNKENAKRSAAKLALQYLEQS